jgi:hypothetical protein
MDTTSDHDLWEYDPFTGEGCKCVDSGGKIDVAATDVWLMPVSAVPAIKTVVLYVDPTEFVATTTSLLVVITEFFDVVIYVVVYLEICPSMLV